MRRCSSSRKLSAVQPWRRKRNFSRARSRCSRNTSESRNSSAIPLMAGSTWFQRTNAFNRARQIGLGGKSSRDAQREADFGRPAQHARRGRQSDIVDLRIRAPHAASGNRDLEFAGQVVEVAVARQHSRRFERQRRSIANFVRIYSRDRAAGDIAHHVAAGANRVQSHAPSASSRSGSASIVTQCN